MLLCVNYAIMSMCRVNNIKWIKICENQTRELEKIHIVRNNFYVMKPEKSETPIPMSLIR